MSVLVKTAVPLVLAIALFLSIGSAARAGRRVALVIGNANYAYAGALPSTVSDADAIAELLTRAGFDVVQRRSDLSDVDFWRALENFSELRNDADIALFVYSGYALAVGGVDYLVPVDAKLSSAAATRDEAISLDWVFSATDNARHLSLVILDACRETPFHPESETPPTTEGPSRGHPDLRPPNVSRGLVEARPPDRQALIAYADRPGSVCVDGEGPFAAALVKHLAEPGLDIRAALGKVRDEVLRVTGNRQEPSVYGSLEERVSLAAPELSGGGQLAVPDKAAPSAAADQPARPVAADSAAGAAAGASSPPLSPSAASGPANVASITVTSAKEQNAPVAPAAAPEVKNEHSGDAKAASGEAAPVRRSAAGADTSASSTATQSAAEPPPVPPPPAPGASNRFAADMKVASPAGAPVQPAIPSKDKVVPATATKPAGADETTAPPAATADVTNGSSGDAKAALAEATSLQPSAAGASASSTATRSAGAEVPPVPPPPTPIGSKGSAVDMKVARPEAAPAPRSPPPASRVADAAERATPDAKSAVAEVPPGVASAKVAALSPDEICDRDERRLERLRGSATSEEARRFADELGCEKLQPQLARLIESLGAAPPAPASTPPGPSAGESAAAPAGRDQAGGDCGAAQDALSRLRAAPSAEAAQRFWRDLRCERLRPQVRLLLESLGVLADPPSPPSACRRESEELSRIRMNPDRSEAERFAREMTCDALKPQAARLLESLTE